jgi:hypothetical protein
MLRNGDFYPVSGNEGYLALALTTRRDRATPAVLAFRWWARRREKVVDGGDPHDVGSSADHD